MPEVSCQGARADHAPQFCGFPVGGIRIFARVFVSFRFPFPAPSPGGCPDCVYPARRYPSPRRAAGGILCGGVRAPWWMLAPCGLMAAPAVVEVYPLRLAPRSYALRLAAVSAPRRRLLCYRYSVPDQRVRAVVCGVRRVPVPVPGGAGRSVMPLRLTPRSVVDAVRGQVPPRWDTSQPLRRGVVSR